MVGRSEGLLESALTQARMAGDRRVRPCSLHFRHVRMIRTGSPPYKHPMSQFSSEKTVPGRAQEDLEEVMEEEIRDQTFQFPSSELVRILSPKTLERYRTHNSEDFLDIDHYHCKVDEDPFDHALSYVVDHLDTFSPPSDPGEIAYYNPLAEFLTGCVRVCHDALDEQEGFPDRQDRWYNDLEFVVEKSVASDVEDAAPHKPDIAGGKGISKLKERLCWTSPDNPTRGIMLPVVVKNEWKSMVSQAATYARSLFARSPMRIFALVLAFNQKNKELRFMVFHHGGLAASHAYIITQEEGLREVARLFLTLALWRTATEAGYVSCCNNTTYLLPADANGVNHLSAAVDAPLFQSLCIRGRMTHVFRLLLQALPRSLPPPEEPSLQLLGTGRSERLAGREKAEKRAVEGEVPESQDFRSKTNPLPDVPEQSDGGCLLINDLGVC